MVSRRASKIAVVLMMLGLVLPLRAWAGHHGHYGSYGHHSYYGHRGYYSHHGYYGHHADYGYDVNYYSPRFYDQSGQLQRAVGYVEDLGALDLNVRPKNTQVYLNGKYIGNSGKFDGFPRNLWLKEGTYEVIFYNDGYTTVVREFTIARGVLVDVKQRLQPGASVPPEKLTSKVTHQQPRERGTT